MVHRENRHLCPASLMIAGLHRKEDLLIEIYWGEPISLMSPRGDEERFSTFEKARYWLQRKWPTSDRAREHALNEVEAALDCMTPAATARVAFMTAALSAGYVPRPPRADLSDAVT